MDGENFPIGNHADRQPRRAGHPGVPALSAHQGTNLLIVTDTATNIRRILDILKSVDVANVQDEPQIIPLKHADAQELAPVLQQLFAGGRFRATPGGLAAPPPPPAPGAAPRPPASAFEPAGLGAPSIAADRRSNSLIVNIRNGIPGLSRIPVLGLLFGSREEKLEKTELVLMITPRVVGTAVDAARITEEMRRITPELEKSLRRAPRPPTPTPTPIPPPPPAPGQ